MNSGTTRRAVLAAAPLLFASGALAQTRATPQWGVHEIALSGPAGGNPFLDTAVSATFTDGAGTFTVDGFYDGDGVYRIRFSPPSPGRWTWRTSSKTSVLNDKTGAFDATAPRAGDHGPVGVVGGYHFAHADGTPWRQIGTTAYAWAQQGDALVAQTLASLAASPFNKIRFTVAPHVKAEPLWPFERTGPGEKDWDYDRFNPAFFRRYESRVAALRDLGVVADLILFHPYDEAHGFNDMSVERDEAYLRYVIARLGAYSNVWWSMANEFDMLKSKSIARWDRLGEFVQAADPYGRPRSIHNWRELYDYGKPWITHASIQDGAAVLDDARAEIFRSVWKKPVIFDEVRYEGDMAVRWGDMSSETALMGFWHGLVAGTYVGHGETWRGADGRTWIERGGTLSEGAVRRLTFLKSVMEDGPRPGLDPIDKWWERHLGGQVGQYYLRYFGEAAPTSWEVKLPRDGLKGGERFAVDVLDTWNCTVTPVAGEFSMAPIGSYDFHDPARPAIALPGKPWMAVRVRRLT